jgi:general secretion pathway protein M
MTIWERWAALGQRERVLAAGVGVLLLVVVVRYVGMAGFSGLSLSAGDDTWGQIQKIQNYRRVAARADAAKARGLELEKRYAAVQARLIAGATVTQAGAELQGRLSNLASSAGLNVLSSQLLKEEEIEGFRRVGVRLSLSGELDGVARLLSAIESGPVDMTVTLLEINRKLGATRRPIPGRPIPPSNVVQPLTATMEVKTVMQETL